MSELKILWFNVRRRVGKREDELCVDLGHGSDAAAELIERQLFKCHTVVNSMHVFAGERNIMIVGRISGFDSGPMNRYKLSPYFTQVIWANGNRGTSTFPSWEAASSSLLNKLDGPMTPIQELLYTSDYHASIVKLVAKHFPAELPTAAEVQS